MRPAAASDGPALAALYARCSPESRFHRFDGYLHELPETFVAACLAGDPDTHDALVIVAGDASEQMPIVALGTAAAVVTPRGPAADLSLLVEDGWQGHGLGRWLLWTLIERAEARGVGWLAAQIGTEQDGLMRWLGTQVELVELDYQREAITTLARRRRAAA